MSNSSKYELYPEILQLAYSFQKFIGKMHKPILQLKNVQTYMNFVDIHPWRVFTSCTIHIFADSLSEMKKRNHLTLMGPSAQIVTINVYSGFCMMQLPP
jgi:hypothetical protein